MGTSYILKQEHSFDLQWFIYVTQELDTGHIPVFQ